MIGFAQAKVHLEFQNPGPRVAWISDQLSAAPSSAKKFDTGSFDVDATGAASDSIVQVLDTTSGNVAAKKFSEASKGWLVKPEDFNLIGHLQVKVQHDGAPVEVADIKGTDSGGRPQFQLIDSAAKGVGDFYDVKPGDFKVIVNYNSGLLKKAQSQTFQMDLKRDADTPLLVVEITNPVATISPTAGAASTTLTVPPVNGANTVVEVNPKTAATARGMGEWALWFLGICFAGLVIYGVFTWLQKNHTTASAALQRVGVSLQDPTPFDPASNVPITPAAVAPQQQILLGDAAPTPISPIPIPFPSLSAVATSPQLRGENGVVHQLPEGTSVVSRDPGMGVSLVGESSVSRKHAEVVKSGNHVVVRDLGSTNGTFVNSIKVVGEATLHPGDTVQFGTVRLRYEG
jgi:hypothetical protein